MFYHVSPGAFLPSVIKTDIIFANGSPVCHDTIWWERKAHEGWLYRVTPLDRDDFVSWFGCIEGEVQLSGTLRMERLCRAHHVPRVKRKSRTTLAEMERKLVAGGFPSIIARMAKGSCNKSRLLDCYRAAAYGAPDPGRGPNGEWVFYDLYGD